MLFNPAAVAMTALMTMPAALIGGLDSAGPKRWTRFAITTTPLGSCSSGQLSATYWRAAFMEVTFGLLGALLASAAVNVHSGGRLGMSSLLIAIVTPCRHSSNTTLSLYLC
ncbi:hypothetical protein O9929_17795 [Vibrio lentus]|nr:hypothetical protein [Vibrio lentus]